MIKLELFNGLIAKQRLISMMLRLQDPRVLGYGY